MAKIKIDLNKMISDAWNVGVKYANKLIGSGGSPLGKPGVGSEIKIGNVGGIFGINLNWSTIALIGAGLIGVAILVKKVK
jgi:hypothetical protein